MPSSLSLLLLLPLRCRRNCNQIASLAILLLSALSAKIHEDQVEQRRAEAEEEEEARAGAGSEAGAEEQKLKPAAGLREGVETDPDRDTPYIATKVANPHPIRTSSGITSARGTGTGAALTSWQSSHSHRSPGANSSAQDQEQVPNPIHIHIRKEHLQLTAPSIASRGGTAATLTTKPAHRSRALGSSSSSTNPWLPLANCSWTAGLGVGVAASIAT